MWKNRLFIGTTFVAGVLFGWYLYTRKGSFINDTSDEFLSLRPPATRMVLSSGGVRETPNSRRPDSPEIDALPTTRFLTTLRVLRQSPPIDGLKALVSALLRSDFGQGDAFLAKTWALRALEDGEDPSWVLDQSGKDIPESVRMRILSSIAMAESHYENLQQVAIRSPEAAQDKAIDTNERDMVATVHLSKLLATNPKEAMKYAMSYDAETRKRLALRLLQSAEGGIDAERLLPHLQDLGVTPTDFSWQQLASALHADPSVLTAYFGGELSSIEERLRTPILMSIAAQSQPANISTGLSIAISDDDRRAFLSAITSASGLTAAWDALDPTDETSRALVAEKMVQFDPDKALELSLTLSQDPTSAVKTVLNRVAEDSFSRAMALANNNGYPPPVEVLLGMQRSAIEGGRLTSSEQSAIVNSLTAMNPNAPYVSEIVHQLGASSASSALSIFDTAASIPLGPLRHAFLEGAAEKLLSLSPVEASRIMTSMEGTPSDALISRLIYEISDDPDGARAWAERIRNPETRAAIKASLQTFP